MATNSSPTVGGKIVKTKKRTTPYSRPQPEPDSPNWLSGLLYPAKFVASGFLSFFGNTKNNDNDNDDDSSSISEYDENDENENDTSFQEDDHLHKVLTPSSKSDSKRAIEQLVMQEIYSRKEANELIKLVRSRIVDRCGSIGESTPNLRTTAIMEARKWLQEKKLGSNKEHENEFDVSNAASLSQISRNEKGSPAADMARSYMQSRPAWASPSSRNFEAGSSSPFGVLHFKEETPKSALYSAEDNDAGKSVELQGSEAAELKYNNTDEVKQLKSATAENDFGLGSSLAEGHDTIHEAQPSEGGRDIHMENSNPQGPNTDSSSMQEELSQDLIKPVAKKASPAVKAKNKPKERKPRGGYMTRRSTRRSK